MSTSNKFVNLVSTRLLGLTSFKEYCLNYLRDSIIEFFALVYSKDATIDAISKVLIIASGSDEFSLTADKQGTDGSGHLLITDSTYCASVPFENTSSILYNVALKFAIMPEGITINPRTGYPEYDKWVEFYGESAAPTSVVDNTTYLTFNVNSVCPDSSETHAGRKCMVWKNVPALGATSEALAYEICTVYYSGGNNLIDTSTSGIMGQTTVSTTASDYTVLMLGPSVARVANVDFEPLADYWYIGTLTGGGGGAAPSIPSDSIDNQRLAQFSLSDILDSYVSNNDLFEFAIRNWTSYNTDNVNAPFFDVAAGYTTDGTDDWEFFVAVGQYITGAAELWISKEGKYWGDVNSGTGIYDLFGVCFDANIDSGKWVAVGEYRTGTAMTVVTHDYNTADPENGPDSTWTLRTCNAPSGTPSLRSVASDGTTFVAVGTADGSGYAVIMTSTAVATWTDRGSAAAITGAFYKVTYGNGLFVAVGDNAGAPIIATSANGTSGWTSRTPASGTTQPLFSVIWNGTVFVAGGDNGEIQTSPDGINWTKRRDSTFSNQRIYGLASDSRGNLVAAVYDGNGGRILYSRDNGITWYEIIGIDAAQTDAAMSYVILPYEITYGHGKFLMCGDSGEAAGSLLWASLRVPE